MDWNATPPELPDLGSNAPGMHCVHDAALRWIDRARSRLDLDKDYPLNTAPGRQAVETNVVDWVHKGANVSRIMIEALQEGAETLEEFAEQGRARPEY